MNETQSRPAVLVLDDDPNVLNMLEAGLQDTYSVSVFCDPEKALCAITTGDFDVVVTDVMMPYVSGFEILRRAKEANELIEVILLTGELPDKARPAVSAIQSGAHDYLLKPVRIWQLKSAIAKALEKRGLRLQNKRLIQELVRLANTDHLTGLSNRRHFYTQFYLEYERTTRYQRRLGCLILDVDHFRSVNEAFGHRCGDLLLQRMGELIIGNSRASDLKGRLGGDQFVVILPEANGGGMQGFAQKLHRLVQETELTFGSDVVKPTASVGWAIYQAGNYSSADELICAADMALLTAKREGRNGIRPAAQPEDLTPLASFIPNLDPGLSVPQDKEAASTS
ncbi:MAG: diguanylate cyclase [Acidobacteriota bacterium]